MRVPGKGVLGFLAAVGLFVLAFGARAEGWRVEKGPDGYRIERDGEVRAHARKVPGAETYEIEDLEGERRALAEPPPGASVLGGWSPESFSVGRIEKTGPDTYEVYDSEGRLRALVRP
ncbi:MAG: hypothetical protein KatS3mg076_2771 [Candidatus Binatia bacterium]|nr:MAG: hypothetical protein KatS3mg076_2771 [Candidatus Binatia bacterium]